jgi:prevent-host-death family protein
VYEFIAPNGGTSAMVRTNALPNPFHAPAREEMDGSPTSALISGLDAFDLVYRLSYSRNMEITVHEAKTHFSKLLERVALGEEITILKARTPVARLVPIDRPPLRRVLGWAAGKFIVPDDFDKPLPADEEQEFYR